MIGRGDEHLESYQCIGRVDTLFDTPVFISSFNLYLSVSCKTTKMKIKGANNMRVNFIESKGKSMIFKNLGVSV